ncbi:pyrimidine/purine nucleoside phosphorylase [Shewanella sp. GXUN23E]|uniref:pyrimidine/purine nucleoside phosphorylase n=1 Tax=Shewanella sp. GXUN23E TaxID=3422498 RepID=UPI003D7D37B3
MIKENAYFDGNVKSLGFSQHDGESTVGVMAPGQYTFGTGAPERMTVVKGALTIKRAGEQDWTTFAAGDAFEVAGNSSFELQVEIATAYLCEFLPV